MIKVDSLIPSRTINPNIKRGKLNYYTQFSQTKEPSIKFDLLSMIKSKIHKFYSASFDFDTPKQNPTTRSYQLTLWMDVLYFPNTNILNCPHQEYKQQKKGSNPNFGW